MPSSASLRAYNQKRNFTRTKEPRGLLRRRTGDLFVVHKHAARRLHYDLRLELDGVLKSWAVTRGPSLSPADKRLAVRTEDHPFDYAEFEGKIPEGEYGAGSIIVWDRGRWSTEDDPHRQLAKGHLTFDLHGSKLKGRWHLVHMRGRDKGGKENWLLIKADDEFAIGDGGGELLEKHSRSVKTGRTVEDVADSKVRIKLKASTKTRETNASRTGGAKIDGAQSAPPAARITIRGAKAGHLPTFIEPALASIADRPPASDRWVHEVKFDGYRLLARLDHGRVKLLTRKGLDWTDKFPSVRKALEALPVVTAFLDGEVIVESAHGVPDFSGLQADLSEGRSDRFRYYMFDLMHLDGMDARPAKLVDRKEALSRLLADAGSEVLRLSEHFTERGDVVFKHASRLGLEGIVSKLADAPYRSGRAKSWLKSKAVDGDEFVIIGYVPSTTQRHVVGSLALATNVKGRLAYVGRVGSGFSAAVAGDLRQRLEKIRTDKAPLAKLPPVEACRGVRWVKPSLVAEVAFRSWTADAIIRHAVFKGLRPDKQPLEVQSARPVLAKKMAKPAGELPVRLTHPDRVLWPDVGVTKQGLAEFYAELWPWIEPWVVDRPLALLRCPGGMAEACFFQKHAWAGIPDSIIRARDSDGGEELLAIRGLDGLLALTQASVLEVHVWGSKLSDIERPDGITFDLDPDAEVEWSDVVAAALEVRDRLKARGLASFVKTTGGKGLHVYSPLRPHADWAAVKAFTHEVAKGMASDSPRKYLATASKAQRRGRIFIDYLRNGRGATAVSAYSSRARSGASVSAPLDWSELGPEVHSDRFTVMNLLHRLTHVEDPWRDLRKQARRLPG
jgi:bifunctional non-homologous end joining protein LigD